MFGDQSDLQQSLALLAKQQAKLLKDFEDYKAGLESHNEDAEDEELPDYDPTRIVTIPLPIPPGYSFPANPIESRPHSPSDVPSVSATPCQTPIRTFDVPKIVKLKVSQPIPHEEEIISCQAKPFGQRCGGEPYFTSTEPGRGQGLCRQHLELLSRDFPELKCCYITSDAIKCTKLVRRDRTLPVCESHSGHYEKFKNAKKCNRFACKAPVYDEGSDICKRHFEVQKARDKEVEQQRVAMKQSKKKSVKFISPLSQWIAECCDTSNKLILSTGLYISYESWCTKNQKTVEVSKVKFPRFMKSEGFEHFPASVMGGNSYYQGIKLK